MRGVVLHVARVIGGLRSHQVAQSRRQRRRGRGEAPRPRGVTHVVGADEDLHAHGAVPGAVPVAGRGAYHPAQRHPHARQRGQQPGTARRARDARRGREHRVGIGESDRRHRQGRHIGEGVGTRRRRDGRQVVGAVACFDDDEVSAIGRVGIGGRREGPVRRGPARAEEGRAGGGKRVGRRVVAQVAAAELLNGKRHRRHLRGQQRRAGIDVQRRA